MLPRINGPLPNPFRKRSIQLIKKWNVMTARQMREPFSRGAVYHPFPPGGLPPHAEDVYYMNCAMHTYSMHGPVWCSVLNHGHLEAAAWPHAKLNLRLMDLCDSPSKPPIEPRENTLQPLWFSHLDSSAVYYITVADNLLSLSGSLCVWERERDGVMALCA